MRPLTLKFIAPRKLLVNGYPSPCECDDLMTCAYCVQANLLGLERKFKADESTTQSIIDRVKRNGIRKTAREINVDDGTVRYWLKTKNVPQWVVQKYAGCGNQ